VIEPTELKANAESLVQHVVESAPPDLGVCVIFWNKSGGGAMSATNAKTGKELAEVLRSALVTCENKSPGLILVKPT